MGRSKLEENEEGNGMLVRYGLRLVYQRAISPGFWEGGDVRVPSLSSSKIRVAGGPGGGCTSHANRLIQG